MQVGSIAGPAVQAERTQSADSKRMQEAGQDFEALIIAQMLRAARQDGGMTSLDPESAESDDSITDFAEQQLSKALATAGGLGLAKLVASGLGPGHGQTVKAVAAPPAQSGPAPARH